MITYIVISSCLATWLQLLADCLRLGEVEGCLLSGQLHHPVTGSCWAPLEQGPCPPGSWLVPLAQESGEGECRARAVSCPAPVIREGGEVGCLEQEEEALHQAYTRAHCRQGERLVPANLALHTRPCPAHHACSRDYLAAWNTLQQQRSDFHKKALQHMKDMICSEEPRRVCLPDNGKSPFLAESIYQSFKNPQLVCAENPCPQGQEPYEDENGYVECVSILGLNSLSDGTSEANCRRNQVWRERDGVGKCVSRFFG